MGASPWAWMSAKADRLIKVVTHLTSAVGHEIE